MTEWLAIGAAAFAGLCVACLAVLHVSPTGYSPIANAVSEYGVGPYGRWYRLQATCAGIAAVLLAAALARGVDPAPRRTIVLLVVFALARFAITQFPTDLIEAREHSRTGGIHLLLAAVAFAAMSVAGVTLKQPQHGQPALGWAMLATAVGTSVAVRNAALRPFLGLIERGFYVSMLGWLVLVAVRLA